jgi:glutamate dehydrogenase/leucine dehydrogenase
MFVDCVKKKRVTAELERAVDSFLRQIKRVLTADLPSRDIFKGTASLAYNFEGFSAQVIGYG